MTTILAMDISSVAIGCCLLIDGEPSRTWSYKMREKALYDRLMEAYNFGYATAAKHDDCVLAIEAPAYKSSVEHVALQRTAGAVLSGWRTRSLNLQIVEVNIMTAKKALTNSGKADKVLMLYYARQMLPNVANDHEADAVGVALGAWGKVQTMAVSGNREVTP